MNCSKGLFAPLGDPFKKRILTERTDLKPDTLGLTLAEGKMILKTFGSVLASSTKNGRTYSAVGIPIFSQVERENRTIALL